MRLYSLIHHHTASYWVCIPHYHTGTGVLRMKLERGRKKKGGRRKGGEGRKGRWVRVGGKRGKGGGGGEKGEGGVKRKRKEGEMG